MEIKKILDNLYEGKPSKGSHLTQKSLDEDEARLFCCSVYELSEINITDRWDEWTEAQKREWEEEHKEDEEKPR